MSNRGIRKVWRCIMKNFKAENQISDNSTFTHMRMLGGDIDEAHNALIFLTEKTSFNLKDKWLDECLRKVISHQIKIWVVSFMDEWDNYLTVKNYPKLRIKEFKECLQPVSKIIHDYAHLKRMRNTMLAHTYRYQSQSIFYKKNLGINNAPTKGLDLIQLINCIKNMSERLNEVYFLEDQQFTEKVIGERDSLNRVKNPDLDTEEIREKLEKAFSESLKKLKEYRLKGKLHNA